MTQINQTAAFFTQMNEGAQEAAEAAGCELHDRQRQQRLRQAEQRHRELRLAGRHRPHRRRHRRQRGRARGRRRPRAPASGGGHRRRARGGRSSTRSSVSTTRPRAPRPGQWVVDQGLADGGSTASSTHATPSSRTSARTASAAAIDEAGATYTQSVERRERAGEGGHRGAEPGDRAALTSTSSTPPVSPPPSAPSPRSTPGGSTKVIGWDLTAEVIAGIDSGLVDRRGPAGPAAGGRRGGRRARSPPRTAARGGVHRVPITIVTDDNVDDYRYIFE